MHINVGEGGHMFEILRGGTREELRYCVVWPDYSGRLVSVCGDVERVRQSAVDLMGKAQSACLIEVGPDRRPRSICDDATTIRALLLRLK